MHFVQFRLPFIPEPAQTTPKLSDWEAHGVKGPIGSERTGPTRKGYMKGAHKDELVEGDD